MALDIPGKVVWHLDVTHVAARDEIRHATLAYGLASTLGTIGVFGPVRMDYAKAVRTVRAASFELSRLEPSMLVVTGDVRSKAAHDLLVEWQKKSPPMRAHLMLPHKGVARERVGDRDDGLGRIPLGFVVARRYAK